MIYLLTHPSRLAVIVVFSVFALLPSLVHLTWLGAPATHPLLAAGPLLAGFGLAFKLCHTRVGLIALGTTVAALIWSANWLMMAGGVCCSTINN